MSNYNGALGAAQLITILDGMSAMFDADYPYLGLGASTESGTASKAALAFKAALLGDGASIPGIGNIYAANKAAALDALIQGARWDTDWATRARSFIADINTQLSQMAPTGWLLTGTTSLHEINSQLLRLNAAHTGVPLTPTGAGVLTAANIAGGGLPNFASGNCPFVVYTLGGANDWDESLPSPEASPVALSGSNNALNFQIPGAVPASVTWVKIYRGYVAGLTTIWFYDQKVTVTPSASSYPVIPILQPDSALKTDWQTPAWLGCLIKPQSACQIALSYAIAGAQTLLPGVPVPMAAANMISPFNVALNPSNGFLGAGNVAQGAIFGTVVVGTGFTAGTILTANNDTARVQGFAGATKLQARVTSALNAAGTTAVTYTYYDAANGYGSVQTATAAAATFGGTAAGSLAVITIPAGRLIQNVTGVVNAGGLTSGTYILEAQAVR